MGKKRREKVVLLGNLDLVIITLKHVGLFNFEVHYKLI